MNKIFIILCLFLASIIEVSAKDNKTAPTVTMEMIAQQAAQIKDLYETIQRLQQENETLSNQYGGMPTDSQQGGKQEQADTGKNNKNNGHTAKPGKSKDNETALEQGNQSATPTDHGKNEESSQTPNNPGNEHVDDPESGKKELGEDAMPQEGTNRDSGQTEGYKIGDIDKTKK